MSINLPEGFFIIDSENIDQIHTKLYGFSLINGFVVENEDFLHKQDPSGEGAYVYVKRTSGKITITQDFIGSYGIYLYQDADYFALSNSFLLLVDYVKRFHVISINRNYTDLLIAADLCALAYSETMVFSL